MASATRVPGVQSAAGEVPPFEIVFGQSESMQLVRQRIERSASLSLPVLIRGESGTGKEIIAKLLHISSPWSQKAFVKVNCPAIPGSLLESELFGYERGAFTGAYVTKPGRVETANHGTLFLDEIGDLPQALQAKLLQVLQDGKFTRIGGEEDREIETRVVSATNRDLLADVDSGAFRRDLFYRINVIEIVLPPLRDRRADIPGLVEYFTNLYNEKFNCNARAMSPSAIAALQECRWYGNIRELENLVRRYVILGDESAILKDLTRQPETSFIPEIPLDGELSLKKITRDAVQQIERKVILRVLQAHHWNRKRAAKVLKISYRALLYKLRNAGLTNVQVRGDAATKPDDDPNKPTR